MLKRLASLLIHVVMLAVVCAIAAYWGVRILTPQPTAAPPPMAAPSPREPDPMLAARMFGLVQQQAQTRVAANIQVAGLFAAGNDSSAVLTVDGKPARVYVLGQDVVPGTRLVEVRADRVVLESSNGRQEVQAPPRPAANLATGAPARAYVLDAGSLSAVPSAAGGAGAPVPGPQRANLPAQPAPTMPQPGAMPARPGVPADAYVPGQQPPPQNAPTPAGTPPQDQAAPQS
jgi:general secretion pathway protein C